MIRTDEDDEFDRIAMENNLKGQPYYWSAMEVVIYTKRKCPNCTEVKQFLRAKNINYVEMDMESSPDLPHIFINGKRVDGLAGLREALK
jgi:glutaredoxin